MSTDPRTDRVALAFEGLSPQTLPALLELYAEQAHFKDPFNEVEGRAAIANIFSHMFATLDEPRFEVRQTVTQGEQAFLNWDFLFRRHPGGAPLRIHGATHLRFDEQGRITWHRDYWDAAEELYAKLPLLGSLMRWLQRRLRTPQPPLSERG